MFASLTPPPCSDEAEDDDDEDEGEDEEVGKSWDELEEEAQM